jgi:hypothetical protein
MRPSVARTTAPARWLILAVTSLASPDRADDGHRKQDAAMNIH